MRTCLHGHTLAHARTRKWMEETHEFVAGRRTGNSYLLSGNPRNPETNSHGPLFRVNSILLVSPTGASSASFSFLFSSLFPLTSFLFRARKTFSLSQRKCTTLSRFLLGTCTFQYWGFFLFWIKMRSPRVTLIDWRILFTQYALWLFLLLVVYLNQILFSSSLNSTYWSLEY